MAASPAISRSVRVRFSKLDFHNISAIVLTARTGLSTSVFYDFADLIRMPEKNLAALLNISSRTISNYKEQKKQLEPVVSEHLLKLIALFGKGEDMFGNIDEFNYWLQKPSWNTREKPVKWLTTPGGVDLVADELDRLAHAYVV